MPEGTCSVPGCKRPLKARGLCLTHYIQKRRSGELQLIRNTRKRFCTIDGCEGRRYAKGYCDWHYNRLVHVPQARRKRFDANGGPKMRSYPAKFKIDPATGCWNWLLYKNELGYGMSSAKNVDGTFGGTAHRRFLEFMMGESVDPDMHVDHLCRNKSCVNPAHMEIVTPAENHRRRTQAMWERKNANKKAAATSPRGRGRGSSGVQI